MRLALKLLSVLAVLTLVALGIEAWVEQRRRAELLAMDLEAEARMAVTLRAVVERVAEQSGPDGAKSVVETVNANAPRNVRWLDPRDVPRIPGRDLQAEIAANTATQEPIWVQWPNERGESMRYLYIPIAFHGRPLAVIEASESLAPRTAYIQRTQVHTATVGLAVLLLSATLAVALGRRLVNQPVAALTASVRAFGEGKYAPPRIHPRRDELGTLATELSALGAQLATRERLRHEDRLRTIGQLASGVAHELGTPLSVVAVRARLIASGESSGAETAANASAILEQADRMTRIVRQLLDYSRRGAAKTTLVDLRQAMLHAVELLEPLARARNVSVIADAQGDGVQVRGDAVQLEQVLMNLVMNAIQAMPTGGRVELCTGRGIVAAPATRGGAAGERCWIRVRDDGPGVSAEDLPHVFEPFFTTKASGEGTGLGLAVAQAIAEEHDGWIDVRSEPGRGAEFTLYLPAAAAETERLAS